MCLHSSSSQSLGKLAPVLVLDEIEMFVISDSFESMYTSLHSARCDISSPSFSVDVGGGAGGVLPDTSLLPLVGACCCGMSLCFCMLCLCL